MLVDSHCHLDRLDWASCGGSLAAALDHARERGIGRFLCVSIDLEDWPAMMQLIEPHAEVLASVGVHPNDHQGRLPDADELVALAAHPRVIAIGETGLDHYRTEGDDLLTQREQFRVHIAAAKACRKPLIIHTRAARADTIAVMREEGADTIGGVMHCFTEDWDTARAALDLGFYISFSGIVTFRSADELREVAKQVPLDRILVETDSPYLAPIPHRGKPNQPAYVREVAEFLAELRGLAYETLAKATTANFNRLFGVTSPESL
jgi:TatD DNase family protein